MDTIELKFVLKLLGENGYRTTLSKIQLNKQNKASEREKICRQLCARDLVSCSYEVTKLKIAPPGKALLKLDSTGLPVTEQELKVLRASEKEKITPGKTGIPTAERQAIIQGLADRGLIELEKKIKEVWLSEQGQEHLRDEYNPKGTATISLALLDNYLRFLRKSLRDGVSDPLPTNGKPDDAEVLQTIQKLDRELGTDNYLPMFHLRQKLQPLLSREDLDQALYRLQRNNQIELRALVHAQDYSQEQVNAGISQRSGSPLFFIKVTVNN
ncbi:hypothetical protein [Chroococcidiopsis sp. CCMEE 29]|uniref:hypothetical protein n=1 Tax=Chroococcidiopsis sp. CCMEE 29 TaxID=155894 RepID=UPI002021F70E|nr:hypothetical protein [Chroococcidiopsis sp. CCMEE 29]